MPILYGEREAAFTRLQHEIIKLSDDQTIFAWIGGGYRPKRTEGIFASSPIDFWSFKSLYYGLKQSPHGRKHQSPFDLTNVGLRIEIPLIRIPKRAANAHFNAALNCEVVRENDTQPSRLAMVLEELPDGHFVRTDDFDLIPYTSLQGLHPRTLIIRDKSTKSHSRNIIPTVFRIEVDKCVGDFNFWNAWPIEVLEAKKERGRAYITGQIYEDGTQAFEFYKSSGGRFIIVVGVGIGNPWCDGVTDVTTQR